MTSNARAVLLFAVLMTFATYCYNGIASCSQIGDGCYGLHRDIVNGIAPATYQYRILAPALVNLFVPNASDGAIAIGYAVLMFVCLAVLYPALYFWLKRWVSEDRALIGIGITALCFNLAWHFWFLSPGSMVEITLITLALVTIERSYPAVIVLTALAALNRETGFLLVALFAAFYGLQWRDKRKIAQTAFLGAVWLGITAFLHIVYRHAPPYVSMGDNLRANLLAIPEMVFAVLPLIPLVVMVVSRYRHASPLFKRMTWIAGLYVLAVIGGAVWQEFPRQALSLLPLVLPVILIPVQAPALATP